MDGAVLISEWQTSVTLSGGVLGLGDWRDFPQAHISRTAEEDSTSTRWRPLGREIGERVCGGLSDSDVREGWEEGNSEMREKVEVCLEEDNKYWWASSFFWPLTGGMSAFFSNSNSFLAAVAAKLRDNQIYGGGEPHQEPRRKVSGEIQPKRHRSLSVDIFSEMTAVWFIFSALKKVLAFFLL